LRQSNDQEATMAPAPEQPASTQPQSPNGKTARDRIVEAFMGLLGEHAIEQIGFAEIAAGAEVSLAELRDLFDSKLAILAAHQKEIDRQVLGGIDADMAEELPRERLFDVLMRRIDALSPHKAAVRSLLGSAARNPGLALALNGFAVRSQQWMLTAADISASGPRGMMRAQGLALLFATVLRTWLQDEDPGLARTMSALDQALARGQRLAGLLDDLSRIPACVCRPLRRRDTDANAEDTIAA
jgi:AcrR family transcriptional regulator